MDRGIVIQAVAIAFMVIGGGAALVSMFTKEPPRTTTGKTTDQRVREGPYIASTKDLSATEDLRIVVVPSPLGEPLDVKCLIYRNREMNQVVFTCPDVRQEDISLPELDRPR